LLVKDAKVSYATQERALPGQKEETHLREKFDDVNIPIFESITLQNINVSSLDKESGHSLLVLLHSFTIDDIRDRGPLFVKGAGTVNKTDFALEGQLGSVRDVLRNSSPYPIDLALSIVDLRYRVRGTIADPIEGKGLDILVTADEVELSNMFDILNVDVPRLGQLDLDARITGNTNAPRVSDFSMKISGEPGIEMSARGSITELLLKA
jgi:hypothetical protein